MTRCRRELIIFPQPNSSVLSILMSEDLPLALMRASLGPVSNEEIIHCVERLFLQFGIMLSNQFYIEV